MSEYTCATRQAHLVAHQQIAQVDGPGARAESLLAAHGIKVPKKLFPLLRRQDHYDAGQTAVPVVALLVVRQVVVLARRQSVHSGQQLGSSWLLVLLGSSSPWLRVLRVLLCPRLRSFDPGVQLETELGMFWSNSLVSVARCSCLRNAVGHVQLKKMPIKIFKRVPQILKLNNIYT